MGKSLKNKLAALFWENFGHMFSIDNQEFELPECLYHYTNIDGMMGIIKSRELWMTKSDFLNDSNEIIYLRELKHEILREFKKQIIENNGENIVNNELYIEFVDQFKKALNFRFDNVEELYEIYILSLSDKKDSLVLWGNYAKGDGYNIGFNAKELVKEFKDRNIDYTIVSGNIIYDKMDQVHIMVATLRSAFEKILMLKSLPGELKQELPLFFKTILITHSMFFKHDAFKAEEEFRIAATFSGKAPVNFRSNAGNIIPYISPKFIQLPIKEIVIGPKNNSDIAEEGIKIFLDRYGYNLDEINVTKSQVPLRY